MSDISLLLQRGWENIWKDKTIWLFSALILIDPLVHLVFPIQKIVDLPSSLLSLAVSFASFFLTFISFTGVSYVAYCIAIGNPVNLQTAFQIAKKIFWRVVALTFLLFLFFAPCLCLVFILSFKKPPQIVDFSHNISFTLFPLSIFAAMWYFLLTETIANDSGIRKSMKTAWAVFTHNFSVLAIIGVILAGALYATNISISIITMLVQNNFDFTALSKLDFISPYLSFTGNNLYSLITAIAGAV